MRRSVVFGALLLGACQTVPVTQHGNVLAAGPDAVKDCKSAGIVFGQSDKGGVWIKYGINEAKIEAMEQAEQIQATHVTWQDFQSNNGWTSVKGEAWRCKGLD
ncbi:hypothetical protein [Aestuariispira insulae]|uniref:DUF4156 domain-containing protein n=1 Tax=Aestuariispira insulae TaxID=1461337 RepID=A0A3D9HHU1_9PROT|nr:hypothetical protein [Aestuariispira insulae]RED49033.1 hypothetical protein DFP90_1069 [Aestuariispira insulae]